MPIWLILQQDVSCYCQVNRKLYSVRSYRVLLLVWDQRDNTFDMGYQFFKRFSVIFYRAAHRIFNGMFF